MENTAASCTLCPRRCGAARGTGVGACGEGAAIRVARAAPHYWEEPCISGTRGSGTVFFSGCALGCVFCQNRAISRGGVGRAVGEEALAGIFLRLAAQGVHNLNLVTAGHFRPGVVRAVALARAQGLALPVVWNTGGYEAVQAVRALGETVDVWLTDLKFFAPALSAHLAGAPDYFAVASKAVKAMVAQAGPPVYDSDGLLVRGVVVRLLVLPGQRADAKAVLHWLHDSLPKDGYLLSLMSQYTPPPGTGLEKPYNRRVASYEYNDVLDTAVALGLTCGFAQARGSAAQEYTPPFDCTGV